MSCSTCHGLRLYYDSRIEAGRHGELKLCDCLLRLCRCQGRPPFFYWAEDARRQECPCRSARRRLLATQAAFSRCEIPDRYRWKFRRDFLDRAPDGTPVVQAGRIRESISRLVGAGEPPRKGLFLHGPPGTGKTLLACILLNELMLLRGTRGLFANLSRGYFQRLRDTFSEESQSHGQFYPMLEGLIRVPYLVLDDLGVQRGTGWEQEVLYDLVDGRYAEERFTIVTTNEPLEEIESLSRGRIYSRLMEMCHRVELDGVDWRRGF